MQYADELQKLAYGLPIAPMLLKAHFLDGLHNAADWKSHLEVNIDQYSSLRELAAKAKTFAAAEKRNKPAPRTSNRAYNGPQSRGKPAPKKTA